MSTALSHLFGPPPALLSGSNGGYNYADLLEEQFGPARAVNVEGLDELFEAVENLLETCPACGQSRRFEGGCRCGQNL